jgi:hypothetical protein
MCGLLLGRIALDGLGRIRIIEFLISNCQGPNRVRGFRSTAGAARLSMTLSRSVPDLVVSNFAVLLRALRQFIVLLMMGVMV